MALTLCVPARMFSYYQKPKATMNYLQKYQQKLGLDPDGKIGPKTASAMMTDLGITDKLFFAHMMGQVAHESGGFTHTRENLNYSAQGLANTWSKYSSTGKRGGSPNALANKLSRNPEAIANNKYADILGNGNEASGDGWKYRGLGGIQLTGKQTILKFLDEIGLPHNTNLDTIFDDPKNYFLAGVFFFKLKGLDDQCTGTSKECITSVTKVVNGGTNGLDDRIAHTNKIFSALGLA